MSVDLWISVALAIPLAIAANIATPRVQLWLEARISRGRERKAAQEHKKRSAQLASLQREYEEIVALKNDPTRLTHLYLNTLLWIAFYGAFGSIYGAFFGIFHELNSDSYFLGRVFVVGAQATALFVALLIFAKSAQAIRTARRCHDFDKYSERTKKMLAELSGDDI